MQRYPCSRRPGARFQVLASRRGECSPLCLHWRPAASYPQLSRCPKASRLRKGHLAPRKIWACYPRARLSLPHGVFVATLEGTPNILRSTSVLSLHQTVTDCMDEFSSA
ncbi:unnamed protein product [Chondrus crispus]|uniref:Uncharacterized protein n=1 Tax=Chondrus crispus TaxID=2769 RepID=R7Q684_CHOCR|nr:unnamed protein product [Chondrus crispus]CDF33363.1 unnamed protein product [Chondrus crispus]|eukprot:XP_005713166.1 unnamed protein product [Chondrus crispus]